MIKIKSEQIPLKCLCSAPSSEEEKVRISASLVGAGRGNGATAKPRNRTTAQSGGRRHYTHSIYLYALNVMSAYTPCVEYKTDLLRPPDYRSQD